MNSVGVTGKASEQTMEHKKDSVHDLVRPKTFADADTSVDADADASPDASADASADADLNADTLTLQNRSRLVFKAQQI